MKVGTKTNENSWTSIVRFSKSSHICLSFYQNDKTFSVSPLLFYCRINSCQKNIQTIYHLEQIPVSFSKYFFDIHLSAIDDKQRNKSKEMQSEWIWKCNLKYRCSFCKLHTTCDLSFFDLSFWSKASSNPFLLCWCVRES